MWEFYPVSDECYVLCILLIIMYRFCLIKYFTSDNITLLHMILFLFRFHIVNIDKIFEFIEPDGTITKMNSDPGKKDSQGP